MISIRVSRSVLISSVTVTKVNLTNDLIELDDEEIGSFLGVDKARHGNPPIGSDVRWQRPG